MKSKFIFLCLALVLSSLGCSTSKKQTVDELSLDYLLNQDSQRLTSEEVEKFVQGQLTLDSLRHQAFSGPQTERQAAKIRFRLARLIKHFLLDQPAHIQQTLHRGRRVKEALEQTLHEHNLPKELYYVALVESNFYSSVRSPSGAVGYWQLMPETAKDLGLKITLDKDEREDPVLSTRAAAKYLKKLHKRFQCWYLALAAYNSGPQKISRAILKGRSRNFWILMDQKLLPQETLDYIPKFLAVWMIGENPTRFGLK